MNNLHPQNRYRSQFFFLGFTLCIVLSVTVMRIVIGPFILALVLAYVLNPAIEIMEKKGIKRSLIVVSAILLFLVTFLIASWFVIPILYHQMETLVRLLPKLKAYVESHWLPNIYNFFHAALGLKQKSNYVPQLSDLLPESFQNAPQAVLWGLGDGTRFLASWLIAGILSPLFAFFVMRDFRKISLQVLGLIPPDLRGLFLRFLRDVDHTLRAVLRGQIVVISLLSVLYATAFFAAGLPAGIVVGIITGFSRLVPYLDLLVGGTLSFLILATNGASNDLILSVVVSFVGIQILDGVILTPRIMGQFSGLHPFIIILSVLTLGDWFGFYGVLLAIPLAAVGRVVVLSLIDSYKRSRFFRNSGEHTSR
jgi:predicted PurR-regulated permease PerM